MKYTSTRNKEIRISTSEAIIQGISKEGGLFVPERLPEIDRLESLLAMGYRELSYEIMSKFFTDFEPDVLRNCINKAYDTKFTSSHIVPVVEVEDVFFLELFHGPTLAFKDMALSILPHLLRAAMTIRNIKEEVVILTATSGDTGKAALEGFANVEGIKIIVFYPKDGVSEIQKLQMITQEGENTFVVGIDGNFDDAQSGVKEIFNDEGFINILDKNNYIFSSANSINIGRLVPQIVYYFYSYLTLLRQEKLKENEKINIVVPTGNFGNILAAYYAKQMGLPVNKLICASNENNVLWDFLNTGKYDKRRKLKLTSSPSMDILVSSNLERLLYHLSDENDVLINSKMRQLNEEGYYIMDNINIEDFYGNFSTEVETIKAIKQVYLSGNYLMDTHTAVAYNVFKKYKLETHDNTKTLIASTASPFKFGKSVASAIGIDLDNKDEFAILEEIEKASNIDMPNSIKNLKDKKVIHNNTCSKEDMKHMIKKFLKVGDSND